MKFERLSDPNLIAYYLAATSSSSARRESAQSASAPVDPMLQLVQKLAGKAIAAELSAGTSHDVLIIGESEQISVAYLPHMGIFRICYHGQKKAKTFSCFAPDAESLIDALLVRLSMCEDFAHQK